MRATVAGADRIVALWALLLASGCGRPGGAPAASPTVHGHAPLPDPLPEIAARVNGQPIPVRNLKSAAERAVAAGEPRPAAYRQALEQAIARELLLQEALARDVSVDAQAVQRAYDQARVDHKDDTAWAVLLAQSGLDPQTFKTELRIKLTVDSLRAQEIAKVPPLARDEALAYYEAHPEAFETGERLLANHVLIRVAPGASADESAAARTRAEGLLARIRAGEALGALAKQYSQDRKSAEREGRLPEITRNLMPPAFERAAFALQPGQVSDVVESPAGFHVIQLHGRLPSRKRDFDEVAEPLRQQLTLRRQQEAVEALVKTLRAQAKIETFL